MQNGRCKVQSEADGQPWERFPLLTTRQIALSVCKTITSRLGPPQYEDVNVSRWVAFRHSASRPSATYLQLPGVIDLQAISLCGGLARRFKRFQSRDERLDGTGRKALTDCIRVKLDALRLYAESRVMFKQRSRSIRNTDGG